MKKLAIRRHNGDPIATTLICSLNCPTNLKYVEKVPVCYLQNVDSDCHGLLDRDTTMEHTIKSCSLTRRKSKVEKYSQVFNVVF
jgi:hypothetical protein